MSKVLKPTICRYCGNPVVLTSNKEIYGREFRNGKIYLCRNCGAFVGTHPGTDIPLGTLANEELREYRKEAHFWFDRIWKRPTRITTRYKAYGWLALKMELPREKTHIGMFEKEQCIKVVELVKQRFKERGEIFNVYK